MKKIISLGLAFILMMSVSVLAKDNNLSLIHISEPTRPST